MHARAIALASALATGAATLCPAQTPAEAAAANLSGGAQICLTGFRDPAALPATFASAGWTLSPGMDAGSYELAAPGVFGVLVPGDAYCMLQSSEVGLDATRAIGHALVERFFPGTWRAGAPEGGTGPCDGFSVFPGQGLIWMSFSSAGNSGECVDDGGAIILRM